MRSVALLSSLVVPLALQAQERGVPFERELKWEQVQARAGATNKYVLVNVCTPRSEACVRMDSSVWVHEHVIAATNDKFVAVRVLGDTTTLTNDARRSYIDGPPLHAYNINVFPTFLFYALDGRLVHRASGERDVNGLLLLLRDAVDPAKQYYVQLERYHGGVLNSTGKVYLARAARTLGEMDVARSVARDYIDNLSPTDRYTPDNLRFIAMFTERSSDHGFTMFLEHADTIDQVLGRMGYAQAVVDRAVWAEEIDPVVFPKGLFKLPPSPPDWTAITAGVARRCGAACAERNVLYAQIAYNRNLENWTESFRLTLLLLDRYEAILSPGVKNDLTWEIFLKSHDRNLLTRAASVMEPVARVAEKNPAGMGPALIDTYANLLYKLGRTADALAWQEKAVDLSPPGYLRDVLTDALAKMKNGEPTWPPARQQEQ